MDRILTFINKEASGLHEAAFLLAGFALLAKLLALFRDRLLAHFFGAGAELDIYYTAFRIPDFIYVAVASLFASAVVIPFVVEKLDDHERAHAFFNALTTIFLGFIAIVSVVIFILMPLLARIVAPGLDTASQAELVLLSRIMLLSPFLLGLSGLFASVTQSLRRFFVYALAPVLYNLGIIAGIIWLYPLFGPAGLAYGVVFGALLHMGIQVPVLIKNKFTPVLSMRIPWQDVRNVFTLSVPRTITLSAHHLVLLALVALASYMAEGSIALFNFSFNLQSVPLSVVGISYATAAFPTLTRLFKNGDRSAFLAQVTSAAQHIIFWSVPMIALLVVLRAQVVRSILGSGAFDWQATRLTAAGLALFAFSITAQALMLLFVRAYYAAGKTIRPLVINVLSFGVIVVVAFVLIRVFAEAAGFRTWIEAILRVEEIRGTEMLMLPLAFSIGSCVNAVLLWIMFMRDFRASGAALAKTFAQSVGAGVIIGVVAYHALRFFDDIFDIATLPGIFLQGLLAGISGILAGILVLRFVGSEELAEVSAALHRKFWKRRPVAPDFSEWD